MTARSRPKRPFQYVGPRGETGPAGAPGADASGDVVASGTLTNRAVLLGNGTVQARAIASLGNAGEVLTSGGAGADPAFAAIQTVYTVPAAKTDTGAVNNWAAGVSGHTLTRWAGASDADFTGAAGGAAGVVWVCKNTGTKVASFAHQSASSTAANRFRNVVTSAPTRIAPGGWIVYQHDGTDWQLTGHNQGAFITPTFAAGDFTGSGSMTWTVDAGDALTYCYFLKGTELTVIFDIITTTVGGTLANHLNMKIPGGYTAKPFVLSVSLNYSDAGSGNTAGFVQITGSGSTVIEFYKLNVANWSAATNTTGMYGEIVLEVN